MRLVGKTKLDDFITKHADVRSQILSWVCEVEDATWDSPQEIKERYPHASIISSRRVIFNIKGNSYRIDTKVSFKLKVIYVLRAGTHSEYSKWRFE